MVRLMGFDRLDFTIRVFETVNFFLGSIVIIQSAGIDLSTLSLLGGAMGVGIGLQNITNNLVSGIIILFETQSK